MTPRLVFSNNKGGVGKTSTTANVACGLVHALREIKAPNTRVLAIDCDSQSHLSLLLTGRNNFGRDDSLYTVAVAERKNAAAVLAQCITPSTWDDDLHVLPSSQLLESAERELIGVAGAPFRLIEALQPILNRYAAVVIDTSPSFSLMTEMALLAAESVYVPCEPRYLETVGLVSVLNKITDIREGWRHPNLYVGGIIITKVDSRIKGHAQMIESLQAHPVLGSLIRGIIPANEAMAYSHHQHMSIYEYDPRCAASRAYALFVSTIVKQLVVQGGM
jgi:chromosome partitioning protein